MSIEAAPKVDRLVSDIVISEQETFQHLAAFLWMTRASCTSTADESHHLEDLCAIAESLAFSERDSQVVQQLLRSTGLDTTTPIVSPIKFEHSILSQTNHSVHATAATPDILLSTQIPLKSKVAAMSSSTGKKESRYELPNEMQYSPEQIELDDSFLRTQYTSVSKDKDALESPSLVDASMKEELLEDWMSAKIKDEASISAVEQSLSEDAKRKARHGAKQSRKMTKKK
ncbi:hypothetical protein MPSEU_000371500 [Mayamaea pseudoterrestris]|nr:hypothetical protein MPSEU_000371500 [Mayamaea pseudoterrestris]